MDVALAWSEQRLGFTGAVHDGPVHPMGAPIDLDLHPGLFAAAKLLGIARRTLIKKMVRYGIERPRTDSGRAEPNGTRH